MLCYAKLLHLLLHFGHSHTTADKKENRVRFFFQQGGKNIHKKGMILLWVKATDMANDQLVRKAKLSPHSFSHTVPINKCVRFYGVI